MIGEKAYLLCRAVEESPHVIVSADLKRRFFRDAHCSSWIYDFREGMTQAKRVYIFEETPEFWEEFTPEELKEIRRTIRAKVAANRRNASRNPDGSDPYVEKLRELVEGD